MRVYFDNAATTPLEPEVVEVMTQTLQTTFGNPSSIHAEGRKARTVIEQARRTVAGLLNASIGEIFFTSCGTESNNMVLKGAVRDLGVKTIITSPTEHPCILNSLHWLQQHQSTQIEKVRVDAFGRVDLEHLEQLIPSCEGPVLVSLMHANNEIGTLLPLEKVAQVCQTHGALFHSDTVQTLGYYPVDVSQVPIAFLSGSAHKFHGPKGVGFVYINNDYLLQPFISGGGQERNMRSGTENIYGIVGLSKALQMACEHRDTRRETIQGIRDYFMTQLISVVPEARFHSPADGSSHYKILSVSFPHTPKSEFLIQHFDIAGVCVSGGSACSSGAEKASHVLEAIQADPDRKTVRFSFSHHNTRQEVDYVMEEIRKVMGVPVTGNP